MNSSKIAKVLLASTVLCGLAANRLRAADSGWILTGDVGPSFVNNLSASGTELFTGTPTTTRFVFKTGVRLDLDAGYQFNDSWTLEGEAGYIYNPVDLSNSTGTASPALDQVPILVNGIFTLPVHWPVKPYLGAGLGVVFSGLNGYGDCTGAGQILAGVKCELGENIDLGVGYKLLVTTEHSWNDVLQTEQGDRSITHAITAAVTIKF